MTIVYHLFKCGIVVYLVNLRHPFLSTPLDVYLVSQLEMFNISFRELILNRSIFEKINPVDFPSVIIVLNEDLENKDVKINVMQYIVTFEKGSWIEKTMIVL